MSGVRDLAARALHTLDPEQAHGVAIAALKLGLGPRDPGPDDPCLAVNLAGLTLPNGVGLAAGFDKNAEVPHAMLAAGLAWWSAARSRPWPRPATPSRASFV